MADTPFTLAGVMRRADARRVAVQILLTRFCLNFQGKPCTSCLSKNYPELFALMGGQVPDLRGLFLRGYGAQSHAQNNGSTVGITSTTHRSGILGEVQGDSSRPISGGLSNVQGAANPAGVAASGVFERRIHSDRAAGSYGGSYFTNLTFSSSRVVPTAEENRPVNMAVRYLVRARP